MSNSKISALTSATTPLAGTETLPVVQSSTTKQVSVANLTAGRAVSGLSFSAASAVGFANTSVSGYSAMTLNSGDPNASTRNWGIASTYNNYGDLCFIQSTTQGGSPIGGTVIADFSNTGGDFKLYTGNLVVGTSGKGIDFSATPGTGTSELLADYEEGTWTPVVTSSIGSITSYTVNAATYTKIGRVVVLNFDYTITNNGTGSGGNFITGLPFNIASLSCMGSARETAVVGLSGTVGPSSATQLYVSSYNNLYLGGNNYKIIGSLSYNA